MKYTEFCSYCGKEYVPKRRGVQQFCSNSCRSRNWQLKKAKQKAPKTTQTENKIDQIKLTKNDTISQTGIGNAAIGVAVVGLTKYILTPDHKRNSTKDDIRKLASLITGQRYLPIKNMPQDILGRNPFYDIEKEELIFI